MEEIISNLYKMKWEEKESKIEKNDGSVVAKQRVVGEVKRQREKEKVEEGVTIGRRRGFCFCFCCSFFFFFFGLLLLLLFQSSEKKSLKEKIRGRK